MSGPSPAPGPSPVADKVDVGWAIGFWFVLILLLVDSCFPHVSGSVRRYHRRACTAELRAARTSRDTLHVFMQDSYCVRQLGKPAP